MKPSIALKIHRDQIINIIERHHGANTRVFGSVLHGDDLDGSDLDILIDPTDDLTIFDIGCIRHELLELLSVPVDVLTPNALPVSFREHVIHESKPL
jgi:predicted nucleotidyltransferase